MLTIANRPLLMRFTVPAISLIALALFSVMYVYDPDMYLWIMGKIMQAPFSRPFADWEFIYSAIHCSQKGVNVFINDPCYTLLSFPPYNYSPLWLYATFIPYGLVWGNIVALSFSALFFLSLGFLPPPRDKVDLAIRLLATLSSATALGIERGNADLIMFLMIIVGARLGSLRLSFRLAGYALFTLAGLLKFYPMVALITVLRERFAVFLAVALAATTSLALLVFGHYEDMVRMVPNLPAPTYFNLQFGAANLPGGLGHIVQLIMVKWLHADATVAGTVGVLIFMALRPLLTVLAIATAIRISRRWHLLDAMAHMPPRDAGFLVVGAAIICGCFFVGQNVVYRGIYLLLALPGLLTLSRQLPGSQPRAAFLVTSLAIVCVQWAVFVQWCVKAAGLGVITREDAGFAYVPWLCNELAWWWIVTVLLAVLATFVFCSAQWIVLSRVLHLPPSWHADRAAVAGVKG